jgi:hypothetical protein
MAVHKRFVIDLTQIKLKRCVLLIMFVLLLTWVPRVTEEEPLKGIREERSGVGCIGG